MNRMKYLAFITTVECGSLTRAAERLHYSQSAISRMIADLENELDLSLLERDRNGVTLTSDGEMLLPCAREVVNDCRKLMMQADSLKGLRSGMIRIATFSSTATHWLPNIIREFQKDYPAVDYELLLGDYEEIERWVQEGRADCGFTRLPVPPDLETVPLEQDQPGSSGSHSSCLSTGKRQRSLNILSSTVCTPRSISPPGMTMQLCRWSKAASGLVFFHP